MSEVWAELAPGLAERLQLSRSMQPCEVDALWQLCQIEAGLMRRISGGACGLFSEQDIARLEWLEDMRLYEAQVGRWLPGWLLLRYLVFACGGERLRRQRVVAAA
jgi:hypothetical protein